ncbi:putative DNA-binding pseudobarrel domain-containing protein [Medicago truncatula]|uniref:Putative DNA-binding pseudobarrel domain-containing protein n=1 Tax=Medicago truncatula TaxID=3880 RepID=A0A396GIK5_MEDTR|nr:putative DNA-binding pseudobarrel domain-containing protein [Medicago truncatula]
MSSPRKLHFDSSSSSVEVKKTEPLEDVESEKSKMQILDNYREPVELPPFLNVKRNSWEIIVNESHMQPNHKLRLPAHLTYEGILSSEKNIMLTQIDRDRDAVDSFNCEVLTEEGDPYKRYIYSGWHAFVKASQVEVGDRLLFSIESYDKNIFVCFVYESDIDSEYDNWSN